jgi:hypothetical protein
MEAFGAKNRLFSVALIAHCAPCRRSHEKALSRKDLRAFLVLILLRWGVKRHGVATKTNEWSPFVLPPETDLCVMKSFLNLFKEQTDSKEPI